MTAFTGSSFFELIISAPFFLQLLTLHHLNLMQLYWLLYLFTSCIAINPNPPVPTITALSSGFRLAFLTAPYAVSPAHDKGAVVSVHLISYFHYIPSLEPIHDLHNLHQCRDPIIRAYHKDFHDQSYKQDIILHLYKDILEF